MATTFVCVVSPAPGLRAFAAAMAQRLPALADADETNHAHGALRIECRAAPWVGKCLVKTAQGAGLLLVGTPWLGRQPLDADAVFARWQTLGERAPEALGGSFAWLVWDAGGHELKLVTDRLATQKIYVWCDAECVVLASGLAPLLAHPRVPRAIDATAVAQFLIASHVIDRRSLLAGVNVAAPASVRTLAPAHDQSRIWWTPTLGGSPDDGLDAWADRLGDALDAAVAARVADDDTTLLPISGGLDSRALAACLPPARARTCQAVSFGPGWCYDVRYGRRLARATGVSFRHLALAQDFFVRFLARGLAACDGEISLEALPMLTLLDAGATGDRLLSGYLGDVLSGGHLLGLPDDAGGAVALDKVWQGKYRKMGFSEAQLDRVLLPERRAQADSDLRAPMLHEIAMAHADTLDEKALLAELAHRQSRYVSYMARALEGHYRVECPFLDRDVMDLFLALPRAHRAQQRAYRRMLVRRAPRLAAVPEIKTHRPVAWADARGSAICSESARSAGKHWRVNAVKRQINALLLAASGGWLGAADRDHYVGHADNARRVAPEWFRQRLLENPLADDWFDRRALRALLDEHMQGRHDHSIRLNNLLAFLVWREALSL